MSTDLVLPARPLPDTQLDAAAIADICDRAAHLIATNGLERGEWWTCSLFAVRWTGERACCTVGALAVSAGYPTTYEVERGFVGYADRYDPDTGVLDNDPPHPALAALAAHLGFDGPYAPTAVMNWSDAADSRTVVEALRACAAGLRIHAGATS